MASKTYTVMKDGETLKEVKTLASAKKLADEEGGKVLCDGETVYTPAAEKEAVEKIAVEKKVVGKIAQENKATENKATENKAAENKATEKTAGLYRLKSLMNVRSRPSLTANILNAKPAGTLISVEKIEGNWLHLTDGSYILYDGGKYAEKM